NAPPVAEDVEFDLAKAAGKGNLLRRRDVLVTKEDDAVSVVGLLDRGERGIVKRSGEIDAADFGAESGAGRNDLDGHRTSWMRLTAPLLSRRRKVRGTGRQEAIEHLAGPGLQPRVVAAVKYPDPIHKDAM